MSVLFSFCVGRGKESRQRRPPPPPPSMPGLFLCGFIGPGEPPPLSCYFPLPPSNMVLTTIEEPPYLESLLLSAQNSGGGKKKRREKYCSHFVGRVVPGHIWYTLERHSCRIFLSPAAEGERRGENSVGGRTPIKSQNSSSPPRFLPPPLLSTLRKAEKNISGLYRAMAVAGKMLLHIWGSA